MTFPRTVHPNDTPDTPTFQIRANGKDINPEYQVLSMVVTRAANRIASADIILQDGNPAEENFDVSSSSDFVPGAEVEIQMGYSSKNTTVFKGIIVRHSVKVRINQSALLCISCRDKAVKLTVGRNHAFFEKQKDSDIIQKLIKGKGLNASVSSTSLTHPQMVQYNSTDWDFILSRADANGMLVFTEDGKITVEKPKLEGPAVSVLYGASIISFDAEMDARYQYAGAKASAWDSATQKIISGKGTKPSALSPGNITASKLAGIIGLSDLPLVHGGQVKSEELKEWASAQMLKSELSKIRGKVRFQGLGKVKPGDTIELGGVGSRFSGKAFVSGVRHEFDNLNWETEVSFGMDPSWFHEQFENIVDTQASGLIPAINGLTIGIVTKLESDPDGEDRVQVTIPSIDPNAKVSGRVLQAWTQENNAAVFPGLKSTTKWCWVSQRRSAQSGDTRPTPQQQKPRAGKSKRYQP
ncbi:MAG: type VI secretion system tip protein VgrG [Bacteroidia bacterium]